MRFFPPTFKIRRNRPFSFLRQLREGPCPANIHFQIRTKTVTICTNRKTTTTVLMQPITVKIFIHLHHCALHLTWFPLHAIHNCARAGKIAKDRPSRRECCNFFAQVWLNYKKFSLAGSVNKPLGLYFLFSNFPLFKQSFTINQTNHSTYISY
jgi:hypothetical protein